MSQAPEDGCTNIQSMLSIKKNNKASDIGLVCLFIYEDDAQSNKRKNLRIFIVEHKHVYSIVSTCVSYL